MARDATGQPHHHRGHPGEVAQQVDEGKRERRDVVESHRRRHASDEPLEKQCGQEAQRCDADPVDVRSRGELPPNPATVRPTSAMASAGACAIIIGDETESPPKRRECLASRSSRPYPNPYCWVK